MALARSMGLTLSGIVLIGGALAAQQPQSPSQPEPQTPAPSATPTPDPSKPPDPNDPNATAVPATGTATPPAVAPAAATPAPVTRGFARVTSASAAVWCFPTDRSPGFDETLTDGDVVLVGEQHGEFRRVYLPHGVVGYVHSDFVSDIDADGYVESDGQNLSFRYRPNSREAPVMLVPHGTRFRVLGQEGDWYRVRYADAPAWMSTADFVAFAGGSQIDTLEKGYTDLERRRIEEWRAGVEKIEAEIAAAAAKVARDAELAALGERFDTERAKPFEDRAYDELKTDLNGFVVKLDDADLAADAPERATVAGLIAAIEKDVAIEAAKRIVAEQPPPGQIEIELPPPPVKAKLAHLDAKGWLRFENGRPVIEKGSTVMLQLTCRNGIYDLRMFEGLEIGVTGAKDRPDSDGVRVLDIDRLVVLSSPLQ